MLSLFPKVSAGMMVVYSGYQILDISGAVDAEKTATMFVPFVKAGMFVEYGLSRNFFFTLGGEFLYMIDTTQGLGMINISASAGYRF